MFLCVLTGAFPPEDRNVAIANTCCQNGPHSLDIGGGIERGLITQETDFTLEIGYGINA